MGCTSSRKYESDPSQAAHDGDNGKEEPPGICPSRKTKAQLIPDPTVFNSVDGYVRKTPRFSARSLPTLSTYLMAGCKTDLDKIRAIFFWITHNVSYDTQSYFSGVRKPQDVSTVLQTGKAVCQGYAQLFEALCRLSSIPCVLVPGIFKGFGHDPENVYTADSKTNHEWNIVFVQGEWLPLDCTLGAGHLSENGDFQQKFDEHWFLTDPVEFIQSHFPLERNLQDSEKYQLIKRPVSVGHFSAAVKMKSLAYTIGLKCLTHSRTIIRVSRDVTIKLKAAQPLGAVNATLLERRASEGTKTSSSVVTSLSDDGTCEIYVRPPRAVTYLLEIMGQARGESDNTFYELLSYVIRCETTHPNLEPFPDKQGSWGLKLPRAVECGLTHTKNASFFFRAKKGQVQVPVPLTRYTVLSIELTHARDKKKNISQYTFLEYMTNVANISVRLPEPGYYLLRVFASPNPEETRLQQVADFLLYSDKEYTIHQPFPQTFQLAHKERTKLLQPLNGQLPSGMTTLVRIHAPTMSDVSVADTKLQKTKEGVWEAEVTPSKEQKDITVYAAVEENTTLLVSLYKFTVV